MTTRAIAESVGPAPVSALTPDPTSVSDPFAPIVYELRVLLAVLDMYTWFPATAAQHAAD